MIGLRRVVARQSGLEASVQGLDHTTFSILGPSGSGKTSYLKTMYATMSSGASRVSLRASDIDTLDPILQEEWREFTSTLKISPTSDFFPYDMVFSRSLEAKATIHLMDFPGGALQNLQQEVDSRKIVNLAETSDAIFVTIDSTYLQRPIPSAEREKVKAELRLPRINSILDQVFTRRTAQGTPYYPSIIVLLTKADLIKWEGSNSRPIQEVFEEIKKLLDIPFQAGINWAMCPVSVGNLGPSDNAQSGSIEPKRVQTPLLIALAYFFRGKHYECGLKLADLNNRKMENRRQYDAIPNEGLLRGKRRRAALQEELNQIGMEEDSERMRQTRYGEEIGMLSALVNQQRYQPAGGIPAALMSSDYAG